MGAEDGQHVVSPSPATRFFEFGFKELAHKQGKRREFGAIQSDWEFATASSSSFTDKISLLFKYWNNECIFGKAACCTHKMLLLL